MRSNLYGKLRPIRFEEVIGQEQNCKILINSIRKKCIGHAYLLYGTRGTGKTTIARIFARALNCCEEKGGNPCNICINCEYNLKNNDLNIIEIDAASNSGVENIRDIKEKILYKSNAKYKIYIIDEAHMLSTGAFNALLKMLEEPPKHVIFILATTEIRKLPPTITSRCQKFHFKPISDLVIKEFIEKVAEEEEVKLEKNVAKTIAKHSEGSARDALSIFEQLRFSNTDNKITVKSLLENLNVLENDQIIFLANLILAVKIKEAVKYSSEKASLGLDLYLLTLDLLTHFKNLLITKVYSENETEENFEDESKEEITGQIKEISNDKIMKAMKIISEELANLKRQGNKEIIFTLLIIRLCQAFEKNTEYEEYEDDYSNFTHRQGNDITEKMEIKHIKIANEEEKEQNNSDDNKNKKINKEEEKITNKIEETNVIEKGDTSFIEKYFDEEIRKENERWKNFQESIGPNAKVPLSVICEGIWNSVLQKINEKSKQLFSILKEAVFRIENNEFQILLKNKKFLDKINKPSGIIYIKELFKEVLGLTYPVVLMLHPNEEFETAESAEATEGIDTLQSAKTTEKPEMQTETEATKKVEISDAAEKIKTIDSKKASEKPGEDAKTETTGAPKKDDPLYDIMKLKDEMSDIFTIE